MRNSNLTICDLCTDHSRTVLSSAADTSCWLSGLNWTERTGAVWPRTSLLSPRRSDFHMRMVWSRLAEATRCDVREN